MTIEHARRLVLQYTDVRAGRDEALIESTARRVVEKGECIWHALAQVTGKTCWCADCKPAYGMHK